ncbi:uncharacterized protein LTR77_006501 [Saxophila tyrrhenica]|uniref:P-loop containing nucleoside triphosphate hydrolase protein n=1 Tax=Saxophila tyrrhenica TaxID=1690608 RepID=A0AAV9PB70_9PEZI|nr:hypothetical protein LTR77_006501 [Saxophila tyrrhenica]
MQRISGDPDIPFADILAPTSTPENPDREVSVPPPTYATQPGFRYDLSSITTGNRPLFLAVTDEAGEAASELARSSSLDPGQASAVVSCLSRSVALVQGPPGTGQSYTGVQLIRVSLANKKATGIGPILVCTHTNHALDAILERSVDDGVLGIVRIGGRSKSERLDDVNLRVLAQSLDLTKTEKAERWKLLQQTKKETEEINKILDALNSLGSETMVKAHLREHYPYRHDQIFAPNEDGWITVGRKQETILDLWLRTGSLGRWRARPFEELQEVHCSEMTVAEKRVMFKSWVSEIQDELGERLRHALSSYKEAKHNLDMIRAEVNLHVLRQASIIGITTSGLARNLDLLHGVDPKLLICEEAGEILEAQMLTTLLPSVCHVILVGDHQQLRPQVQNFELSTESHHGGQRMHPSIAQLVRTTQYPRLRDDPSVAQYPEVVGMRKRLFWMHHDQLEDDNDSSGQSTSRTNAYEVDMVAALVKHIFLQGVYKPADIAVLTPYLGQLRKLRQRFSSTHLIILNDRDAADLEKKGEEPGDGGLATAAADPNRPVKGSLNQALRLTAVPTLAIRAVLVGCVRLAAIRSARMDAATRNVQSRASRALRI